MPRDVISRIPLCICVNMRVHYYVFACARDVKDAYHILRGALTLFILTGLGNARALARRMDNR